MGRHGDIERAALTSATLEEKYIWWNLAAGATANIDVAAQRPALAQLILMGEPQLTKKKTPKWPRLMQWQCHLMAHCSHGKPADEAAGPYPFIAEHRAGNGALADGLSNAAR